ncbi:MAG: DUF2851 family protein [Bacteroidia bacterium]|nr:DUF2851 family protein [Bacteroidia bacterium]MCF8426239.1 DUF2851 family protein [Bacteroidia bacterium]
MKQKKLSYPKNFKEDLLQFIWKYKYLLKYQLYCTNGQKIDIINPGLLNKDSGPDFFNSKIKLDTTLWAGNIEIHIKSSDWILHQHHTDLAYQNVILHVVWEEDEKIKNNYGEEIPTLELCYLLQESLLNTYSILMENSSKIPCAPIFEMPESIVISTWLDRLSMERLQKKHAKIIAELAISRGNWEEIFYKMLAICFGQKTNAVPFEILTQYLPYSLVLKYKGQKKVIECLILGSAGFLNKKLINPINISIQNEFVFLQQKHNIKTMENSVWKFGKTRPSNFPTIRLFQFAAVWSNLPNPIQSLLKCNSTHEIINLLVQTDQPKVDIGDLHPNKEKTQYGAIKISKQLGNSLLINAIIPVLFAYAKSLDNIELQEKVQNWLNELPTEENHIINDWKAMGIISKKASESQALIQLKTYYCNYNRCLQCAIGNHLLKKNISV